jgi:hypothetical protein
VSDLSDSIISQADIIINGSKSLDYAKIVKHDSQEINKLKLLLSQLGLNSDSRTTMTVGLNTKTDSSSKAAEPSALSNEEQAELKLHKRTQDIVESLAKEEFEPRINSVYNTTATKRIIAFSDVLHTRGLPSFDVVLAPDFSPVTGLHAIFVSSLEVFSAVLPEPGDYEWKVLKRRAYMDLEQMVEFVTLLSAGFDLE